jgi:predicted MPP superfamily phosphohydrolase
VDKVAEVLQKAKSFQPHVILATGDLCDRLSVYGDVLKLLDEFNAPLGAYASLGNHEYYRGIRDVLRIYEKGPVPLLINRGISVKYNGHEIYFAGADDPRMLRGDPMLFLQQSIDKAMDGAPVGPLSILMSHRPRGLVHAADLGVSLVLAGHTHGGQLGLGQRSVFDAVLEEQYLWGLYRRRRTVLYTSSGMGHWFPFRLGCPAEAPILELTRA